MDVKIVIIIAQYRIMEKENFGILMHDSYNVMYLNIRAWLSHIKRAYYANPKLC